MEFDNSFSCRFLFFLLILNVIIPKGVLSDKDCVLSQWTSWGSCSQPCGNDGISMRSRTKVKGDQDDCIGQTLKEFKDCNRICYNDGVPHATGCTCKAGFTGTCCKNGAAAATTLAPKTTSKRGKIIAFLNSSCINVSELFNSHNHILHNKTCSTKPVAVISSTMCFLSSNNPFIRFCS